MDVCTKKIKTLYYNMVLAYSLVWGKCSGIMRNKVEVDEKYAETSRDINILRLIYFIKYISYFYNGHKHVVNILYEDQQQFLILYQGN